MHTSLQEEVNSCLKDRPTGLNHRFGPTLIIMTHGDVLGLHSRTSTSAGYPALGRIVHCRILSLHNRSNAMPSQSKADDFSSRLFGYTAFQVQHTQSVLHLPGCITRQVFASSMLLDSQPFVDLCWIPSPQVDHRPAEYSAHFCCCAQLQACAVCLCPAVRLHSCSCRHCTLRSACAILCLVCVQLSACTVNHTCASSQFVPPAHYCIQWKLKSNKQSIIGRITSPT